MAKNAQNVDVLTDARVYFAPLGTALPTSATSQPGLAFKDVGWLAEDPGISETMERETNDVKGVDGSVLRSPQTSFKSSWELKFAETNDATINAFYGNGDAEEWFIQADQLPRHVWLIDVMDGNLIRRTIIPDGQITATGSVEQKNSDGTAYPVTITAYPYEGKKCAKVYRERESSPAESSPAESSPSV
jgi:hypothetical protein